MASRHSPPTYTPDNQKPRCTGFKNETFFWKADSFSQAPVRRALRRAGLRPPPWGRKSNTGGLFDPEKDDGRGAPREKPLALGTVATGARDRTATARTTAVACGRHQPLDMVQAAQTGAGCGHRMRRLRPRGISRSGIDPRPCTVRGARTRDNGDPCGTDRACGG